MVCIRTNNDVVTADGSRNEVFKKNKYIVNKMLIY